MWSPPCPYGLERRASQPGSLHELAQRHGFEFGQKLRHTLVTPRIGILGVNVGGIKEGFAPGPLPSDSIPFDAGDRIRLRFA